MKIEDNFLGQKEFDELQTLIMGEMFDWHYSSIIDYKGQKDKFMFYHMFYYSPGPCSQYFEILKPIFEIINPISIVRVKTNLLTRTLNIIENEFHTDKSHLSKEKLKLLTTSIFYVNTNNGYTEFENGEKVESVANRLVVFPANLKHRGTSCTDERTRIVINFNYFK